MARIVLVSDPVGGLPVVAPQQALPYDFKQQNGQMDKNLTHVVPIHGDAGKTPLFRACALTAKGEI